MQSKGMVIYVLKDLWEIWTLNESIFKYFPGSSVSKESACNLGDRGSIPGSGIFPWKRNDNQLQYPCLENPMDREAQRATVHVVARVGHSIVTELNWTELIELVSLF